MFRSSDPLVIYVAVALSVYHDLRGGTVRDRAVKRRPGGQHVSPGMHSSNRGRPGDAIRSRQGRQPTPVTSLASLNAAADDDRVTCVGWVE